MLNCMPNLEALFWQHIMPEPWSNPSPIRLSSLHTLSLFQDYDPDFRLFFHSLLEWLTCDSLRILRFQGYQDTLPVLKNFLGRCSSTLQELWINTGDLQSTHVVELLEYVPDLVSLSILGAEPELFFALTKSNDDGTAQLLPRLREMRIYDQVKIDDVAPLVGMVESRVRLPGSYLKVVGVDKYALNILEDVQQRTDEWASWGITVKIFDGVWFFLTAELH
ncbi:hypothetical protein MPER_11082 [Moniliophthora perniciosa FA553]|nr:hypothetical protein MPER_11082 [Moniliophthora perniciosa FA553]